MTHSNDSAAEPHVAPARKSLRDRFSLVWLVPFGALAVSLWVVFNAYNDRGPLIEIAFESASGVKIDETELRYREVTVGVVEEVRFSDELADVVIAVRVHKDIAPYIDDSAQFWVVRPEVSARGVSGLDTVLSGVYIEGSWDSEITGAEHRFKGLERPPLVRSGQKGIPITLRSNSIEGLSEGTPILYRGIEVGQVANLRLSDDGVSVMADGFIRSPEDRLITTSTRFWDTSGFTFSFGAQGAQLDVSSLASLVSGGVAFDTIVSGGEAVEPGQTFQLFGDEETARNSVFTDGDEGPTLDMAVIFEGSVSGLAAGAAVEFQGIKIGTVTAITGLVDEDRFGDRSVRLLATLSLKLVKMGLSANATPEQALDFLDDAVSRGMRAQLQNASILTGGLKVSLLIPNAIGPQLPGSIDRDGEPYPIIPSIPANLSDFSDTAEGVFNRINELPIEELLGSAINVMDSVNRLLNDEGTTGTPAEVMGLIADIRTLVGSDQVQGLPVQAADVMATLQGSVASLETLLQEVRDAGAVNSLVAALESAQKAADAVTFAVADVDELIAELQVVARSADTLMTTANALPLEALLSQATTILASADTLLEDPATKALPETLRATVDEARGVIADLRSSGIVDQVGSTLTSAESAVNRVTEAVLPVIEAARSTVDGVNASLEGLPTLITELEGVATSAQQLMVSANALPLEDLVSQASAVIVSANAILNDPEVKALPADLRATVAEAGGIIADLRESGVVGQVGTTLSSAQSAVNRVTEAVLPVIDAARSTLGGVNTSLEGVPSLITELEGVAADARGLMVTANALPLDELVTQATGVIVSANAILNDPATKSLPVQLGAAVETARDTLADLRASGVIDSADATLDQASNAVSRITEALLPVLESARSAVTSLDAAATDLPRLTARADTIAAEIEKLVASAGEIPLEDLADKAGKLIDSANTLIASSDTQAVPAALNDALAQIEGVLADMREGGLIENANATLAATQQAATAVADASNDLPALLNRMNRLLAEAEGVVGGYDANGQLGSEAKSALRDIRDAAKSVSSLARAIERSPNSLLFGR
ncbi:PqiB family protein [Oceaniglobus trochenteri]|uniref:PqiB family protein n=1 Tax=Oceaniglobus trochenteri TaxID=2763260 RepID=UPI001D0018FF|nr:MlaD family protein [Oceaniglobus trochenteri]